jgi:hypothetical protein
MVAATRLDTHAIRWLSRGMAIPAGADFADNSVAITSAPHPALG